jgi:hypothetical protein
MFVFQSKEFILQLVFELILVVSSFFFLFFRFFNFGVRSVDQLACADHFLEDSVKFGHKAERDMKVNFFECCIFLASYWNLIQKFGMFFWFILLE